jgi:hypothetical protein
MLFSHGRLMATPGAILFCEDNSISMIALVRRHLRGDWGNMSAHDKKLNDDAVRSGQTRIFSAYEFTAGRLWVITEWDRSVTTVLLPSEY